MQKKLFLAVLIASAMNSTSALAVEAGGYGNIGIGMNAITDNVNTTYSLGAGLGLGYNINKYVGIESDLNAFGIGANVSSLLLNVAVVGYVPIKDGLDIYGKAGRSLTSVSYGTGAAANAYSGTTSMFGLGAEFSPAGNTSYRIGVDHYDLAVVPGSTLSTNFFNLTTIVRY